MRRLHVGRGTFLVALLCLMAAVGAIIGHSSHPKSAYQKPAMWMPAPTGLAAKDVPVTSGGMTTVADTTTPVHVVRELTAKRSASSLTYLLSNGLNETHFFGEPVNFKNADGSWKRIDTKLIADSSGTLHTAATSGSLTLAKKAGSAAPVRLANAGSVLAVDVLGLDSTHLSASKSSATYADAAPGVSLTYKALSTGVEQIINLAGADAANSFTCRVTSPGLSLRATGQGQWAFFAPGATRPKFFLTNFSVIDSANPANADPAVCADAQITVKSKGEVSLVTYTVPRSWMSDPARVYPVRIDPTFFYPRAGDPAAPNSQFCDTYIVEGEPNSSHAPAVHLITGYNAVSNYQWCRGLIGFDLSSLADTSIQSASLNIYKYGGGSNGAGATIKFATMNKPWGPNAKWSNTGSVETSFPTSYCSAYFTTAPAPAAGSYLSVTTTGQVQAWASGTAPNYGFLVYQPEISSQNDGTYRNFWSGSDNGISTSPYLSVTYLPVKVVAAAATTTVNGSGWFAASGGNDDGNTQGRGAAQLTWSASSGADGYAIYAYDGKAFDKVGQTVGNSATTWSSAGKAFYPKDSEISAASWPNGTTGNPYYRAATPDDSSQMQMIQPSAYSGSAGLLAGDGTYLYARARGSQTGPSGWQRINPTATPVTSTAFGPTNLQTTKPALSAFAYSGRVYSGYVVKSGSTATITGVQTASPYSDGGTITFSTLPLERNTGAAITATSSTVLLASDGTNIYNLSYTLTTSGGNAVYDGFKIRKFTMTGSFVSDTTVSVPSYMCSHMLVDGNAIYLGEWTAANGARVLKVDKSTGAVINQWSEDQGTTQVCAGYYDATNSVFWLGNLATNKFYKYGGATGGLDLRDNPNPLYTKMSGTSQAQAYEYYVTPYSNSGGELPLSANTPVFATLDNRTIPVYNEPTHTTTDLGNFAGHSLTARLDVGAAQADITDLSIATWGPSAALSRTYLSSNTAAGYFAPGWRFSFEQGLQNITSSGCDYVDAAGDAHHFVLAGGVWYSPNGMQATLTGASPTYTLTYIDKTVLTFSGSGSSALLASERDRNSNTVTYTRSSSAITITAANSQQIVVNLSGGKITSAVYTTSAGTRQMNYTTASPWQVTSYPGTSAQHVVVYGYDATPRLTSITAKDWPSSGQDAAETLVYASNKLSEVQYPGYNSTTKPELHETITYGTNTATLNRYGRVNDTANTAVPEAFTWNTQNAVTKDIVGTGGSATETDYSYSSDGQQANTVAPNATQTKQSYTAKGLPLASYDENNAATTSSYTDANNPDLATSQTTTTATTWNYYSTTGNLIESVQLLDSNGDSGDYADTQNTYDSYGRVLTTKTLVSGTVTPNKDGNGVITSFTVTNAVWNETDYSNFAANGQPQTVVTKAVKVSDAAAAQDLTTTSSYDTFGNLLTQTDLSGSRTTETDAYDIAGQKLTSTDAMGLVSHSNYDNLGNVSESWQTHTGSAMAANWSKFTYDALGRQLTETKLLSDANGNGTTQSVVTTTYDGLGKQITSSDTTVGGQPEKWIYDLRGNALKHWQLGVVDYTDARATVSTYSATDQVINETEPGNSVATTYAYDNAGRVTKQTNPDGSFVSSIYDGNGNKLTEVKPLSGYTSDHTKVATASYAYDLANRTIAVTKAATTTVLAPGLTQYGFDLAGNQISATGYFDPTYPTDPSGAPTTTSVNSLAWVLSTPDSNGMTTVNVYDTAGRRTSQTKGNQNAVVCVYDDDSRLTSQTTTDSGPIARVQAATYDNYGNLAEFRHTVAGGIVKDTTTGFDSLGRPTSDSESVSGLAHGWTYPVNTTPSPTTTFETISYDSLPATRVKLYQDARNQEAKRVTTINGTDYTRTVDTRDAAERVAQATFNSSLLSNFSFDTVGRPKRQWGTGYQTGASSTDAYAYDADTAKKTTDNLLLATVGSFGTVSGSYTYDNDQRLATATVNGVAETDSFDHAGNISQVVQGVNTTTFNYNTADQLTSSVSGANTTLYGWDATNGFRTSQGLSGNPTQIQYTYTASGQLATYSNSGASPALSATYTYDASGQRTKSVVVQGTQTTTTNYVYDGLTLMELTATYTDTNNPGNNTSWRVDYLYDENDRPYAGTYRSPSSSTSPTVFSIVTTDRGDVAELTDSAGNAFAAYHYDAWGNPQGGTNGIQSQSTALVNSTLAGQIASREILRYAGYAYDAESGLYYCSARSYDPVTRQFITIDPAKADGEESAYLYCSGEPVGRCDPSGLYAYRHKTVTPHYTAKSPTGSTCWKFSMDCYWEYNGNKVRNVSVVVHHSESIFWNYHGVTNATDQPRTYKGDSHGSWYSEREGKFTLDIPVIGTVQTCFPWLQIWMRCDGTTWWNDNYGTGGSS